MYVTQKNANKVPKEAIKIPDLKFFIIVNLRNLLKFHKKNELIWVFG